MGTACVFCGDTKICPICKVCNHKVIDTEQEGFICENYCISNDECKGCLKMLDHQDILNYDNNLIEYFAHQEPLE